MLPQLSGALDSKRMSREFGDRLFPPGKRSPRADPDPYFVAACDIGRVKYKPGERCSIGYRLTIRDRKSGEHFEHLLCGRIYERGGSAPRYAKALARTLSPAKFGPPIFHIEALEMVVWAFPNDRKLNGLRLLADDRFLRDELIPEIVYARWGRDWIIHDLDRSMVSYVPEGRCCVRLDLSLVSRSTGEHRTWVIYGKSHYDDDRNAHAYRSLESLWNSDSRRRGEIRSPRPLGRQKKLQLFWQESVPGQTSLTLRGDTPAHKDLYDRAAIAIANLHRTSMDCDREISVEDIVGQLRDTLDSMKQAAPAQGEEIAKIVDRLIERAPRARDSVHATLHGDLHPKNIYFDGDNVSFIDLDDVCIGPPELDIGALFARVLCQAVIDGEPPSKVFPRIQRFFETYCLHWPGPMGASDVAWYTAAALINERAFRGWRRLNSRWREVNDELFRIVDRINRSDGNALGLAKRGEAESWHRHRGKAARGM